MAARSSERTKVRVSFGGSFVFEAEGSEEFVTESYNKALTALIETTRERREQAAPPVRSAERGEG